MHDQLCTNLQKSIIKIAFRSWRSKTDKCKFSFKTQLPSMVKIKQLPDKMHNCTCRNMGTFLWARCWRACVCGSGCVHARTMVNWSGLLYCITLYMIQAHGDCVKWRILDQLFILYWLSLSVRPQCVMLYIVHSHTRNNHTHQHIHTFSQRALCILHVHATCAWFAPMGNTPEYAPLFGGGVASKLESASPRAMLDRSQMLAMWSVTACRM